MWDIDKKFEVEIKQRSKKCVAEQIYMARKMAHANRHKQTKYKEWWQILRGKN